MDYDVEIMNIVSETLDGCQVDVDGEKYYKPPDTSNKNLTRLAELIRSNNGLKMEKPKSWKDVFNSELHHWGTIDNACQTARQAGYKFLSWNGMIYSIYVLVKEGITAASTGILADDFRCEDLK